jgi:hypothetical protein
LSYDLLVFAPEAAPRDGAAFRAWFEEQAEWSEDHSYDDPAATTSGLASWFHAIRARFPAMNGPFASQNYDDVRVSDYCIGRHVIYVAFTWSVADEAYAEVRRLAREFEVGFYDVSGDDGDGEIWFPGDRMREPQ